MFFLFSNLGLLVVTGVVSWWLSGFDSNVRGENLRHDYIRRGVRCGLTLLIVQIAFRALWRCWFYGDKAAGILYLATLVPLALIWMGCITEVLAQVFHRLVDPQDNREYDPKKAVRELDAVGELVRSRRKEEAIELCRMLLQTSDDNHSALELTLHHLGVPVEPVKESKPVVEAHRLREAKKHPEAEAILKSMLRAEPANTAAALALMRLYVQDMKCGDKAAEVLRSLEKQRHVPAAHVEFARRSLEDWKKPRPGEEPEEKPESIEGLLAGGYFGTAAEILEKKVEAEPGNFEAWIKLAEVQGKYCANLRQAEKIVRRIEINRAFSAEQIGQARNRLQEWRDGRK